jgi:hypothetical protein
MLEVYDVIHKKSLTSTMEDKLRSMTVELSGETTAKSALVTRNN